MNFKERLDAIINDEDYDLYELIENNDDFLDYILEEAKKLIEKPIIRCRVVFDDAEVNGFIKLSEINKFYKNDGDFVLATRVGNNVTFRDVTQMEIFSYDIKTRAAIDVAKEAMDKLMDKDEASFGFQLKDVINLFRTVKDLKLDDNITEVYIELG